MNDACLMTLTHVVVYDCLRCIMLCLYYDISYTLRQLCYVMNRGVNSMLHDA